ncbi:bifunctional protein-serine/threonine kinase/phosphatase [Magnetospirillum sp. XM-1]|uniref:bifunctional protein-serine/threonine kinase/phosphatase n=1 Tax=Magnetospirillum sp. XM-1 TaxID=1663591 RepID=UPI0009E9915A|nr:bifunctional protein-serine/threonine kinase/phosphatase [Magnetospirillum sp. XM-1]
MANGLKLSIGQHSDKGRKETNQDFHGALVPDEPLLGSKGAAIALADGISTSEVSHIAAESAVKSFMTDYFCTSDAWSVKTSAQRILAAANSWLHAQTQRNRICYDQDRGYVCTLSALILRSNTAYLFHVGDSRIWRLSGGSLEQLTNDHRVEVGGGRSYLGRALGINQQLEIDHRELPVEPGDTFLLTTDGVHEYMDSAFVAATVAANAEDLDRAARLIVDEALRRGSSDNLTLQIVRVDQLPSREAAEALEQAEDLALPPLPEARAPFDGYRIVREIHASSRSHIYLAEDVETGALVALKLPSIDLRGDAGYLRRFKMEEWVARRVNSAHVLKPCPQSRKRGFLYVAMEYVEGQTLAQWMIDNPAPPLEAVRSVVEQIAKGLRAFHRMEMLHQDLRPENIVIDKTGTVKIIDFGSVRVAGVAEAGQPPADDPILGTALYTAPEYFLGDGGSERSDIFSLGVIAYRMLTGRYPYGTQVAKARSPAAQRKLRYATALDEDRELPAWIDSVLEKAVQVEPSRRYEDVSEFAHDLRQPSPDYLAAQRPPLMERNPLLFWKVLTLILLMVVVALVGGIIPTAR